MRVAIVTDKARVAIEGDSTGGNTITVLEQAKLRLENLLVANHQPPGPRQATILADSYSSVILRKTVVTTKSVGLKALYRNVLDVEATEFIGTGAVGIKIHDMARGGRIWESSFINLDVGIDDSCSPIKPKLGKNRDENSNSFRNVRVARIFGPNNCN